MKTLYAILNWNRSIIAETVESFGGQDVICSTNVENNKCQWNFNYTIQADPSVAKSKNSILKYALENGYDWCFIVEDDVMVLDETCYQKYINLATVLELPVLGNGYVSKTMIPGLTNYVNGRPNPTFDIVLPENERFILNPFLGSSFMLYKISKSMVMYDERLHNLEHNYFVGDLKKAGQYPFNGYYPDLHESWKYMIRKENVKTERILSDDLCAKDFEIRKQEKIEKETNGVVVLNFVRDQFIKNKGTKNA